MSRVNRLSVYAVICILAMVFLAVGVATATEEPEGAETSAAPQEKSPVAKYVIKGYSIDGPIQVAAASDKALELFSGGLRRRVELKNLKVTVKDEEGGDLSLADVVKGSKVFLCRKGNEMVVILIASSEPADETAEGKD